MASSSCWIMRSARSTLSMMRATQRGTSSAEGLRRTRLAAAFAALSGPRRPGASTAPHRRELLAEGSLHEDVGSAGLHGVLIDRGVEHLALRRRQRLLFLQHFDDHL